MKSRRLCSVATGILACVACWSALAQPRFLYEIQSGGAIQGPIEKATVDSNGTAWIATPRELFHVVHGEPQVVDTAVGAATRLMLAVGGHRFLRLVSGSAPFGLFVAEVLDTNDPTRVIGTLHTGESSIGFSDIHLGREGRLIVTATPLDDAEGLRGDFSYVLWSADAQELARVKLRGPRMGSVDDLGECILLFGEDGATAIRRDGTQAWTLPDSYRKGVVAVAGKIAVLNPALQSDVVHVVNGGATATAKFGSPVHELAISPDGKLAAVATDKGHLALLRPQSCNPASCIPIPLTSFPPGSNLYIANVAFIDSSTLAVTAFEAGGTPPNGTFENGFVFLLSTSDRLTFRRPIALPQPPTWSPLLGAAYGQRNLAAYTRKSAVFVRARN